MTVTAAPTGGVSAPPTGSADDLRAELAELRARVTELEARASQAPVQVPAAPAATAEADDPVTAVLGVSAWRLSAYAQAQYEWHEDSEDQLAQGGAPLNQDRFLLRRGRVRLDAAWEWTALTLEVDGNTTRGPSFGVRRAEATLLWRGPFGPSATDLEGAVGHGKPPLVALTAGVTEIPFGAELTESARTRPFMERSTGSTALFPGEPDVGVRLHGGVAFFRYDLAVSNGEPLDERAGRAVREQNAAKDFVGRLGVDFEPVDALRVSGGVSALRGEGFHPGSDATKDGVQWVDTNENGAIDTGELVGAPGTAASPSESFDRWAAGLDASVAFDTPAGTTHLRGEAALASNLDRGLFVADPVVSGIDQRELYFSASVSQQITPFALVGFRVDGYDPNADFLDARQGRLLPASQTILTLSPLAAAVLPGRGRLVLQYDHVMDGLARDAQAVPTDLANDRVTVRVEVTL